jgi:hypothetical protein
LKRRAITGGRGQTYLVRRIRVPSCLPQNEYQKEKEEKEKAERARIDTNKAAAAIKKQRGKQSKHRRPYKPRQGRVIGPKLRLKRRPKSRLKSGRKHKLLKLQRTLHQKIQVHEA